MSKAPFLEIRDVTLRFGNVVALDRVSFDVTPGELFAVIGPNGAGKSSLFNVLSRVYEPTAGSVYLAEEDLLSIRTRELASRGIARSFQNLGLFPHLTVLENVLVGRHHLMRIGAVAGGLFMPAARREEHAHRAAALRALESVGIAQFTGTPVHALPYGVQKRVEFARCLAMEPALLLLDEPVAGMSAGEREDITRLVQHVHQDLGLTVVLVEHDMGMVMEVADRVLVLDFGEVIAAGTPAQIQSDDRVIRAYLGEDLEMAP